MKSLKVLSDAAATTSKFLKLRNVKFIQNGMKRSWDYIDVLLILASSHRTRIPLLP